MQLIHIDYRTTLLNLILIDKFTDDINVTNIDFITTQSIDYICNCLIARFDNDIIIYQYNNRFINAIYGNTILHITNIKQEYLTDNIYLRKLPTITFYFLQQHIHSLGLGYQLTFNGIYKHDEYYCHINDFINEYPQLKQYL